MLIAFTEPMPCGNAVRLILSPAAGEVRWKVLRNQTGTFIGPTDPASFLVYDGDSRYVSDFNGLVNDTLYYYAVYPADDDNAFGEPDLTQATPAMDFIDDSVDPQEIVRERLELALTAMIHAGTLRVTPEPGGAARQSIPVLSVPFASQTTPMPVVTVLLGSDNSDSRFLGETLSPDAETDGEWVDQDGWMSKVSLDVGVWSLNGDERILLRKAVKAALIANLPIFSDAGLLQVEFVARDEEDFDSMNTALYKTVGQITCTTFSVVRTGVGSIESVQVTRY